MSIEQIESKLLELPRDERRQFARWFYDHEDEILDSTVGDEIKDSDQAEILRRCDEIRNNPGLAVPVTDEWFAELRQKFSSARSPKASAS